jgi:glycine/D-amino acid oxidase-like deaminating enzyme
VPQLTADIVVCGAGIAGVSTAYRLSVHHGVRKIVLVDDRPPLSLTSDKSTEAYRNWWPGPDDAMVRLMNRSIDLLEELADETGNRFLLNRRGYLYVTADPERAAGYRINGNRASEQGAGELRVRSGQCASPYTPHQPEGWESAPSGADLILDRQLISDSFPYLGDGVVAALHTRRCGWFSGQQLGMVQLERSRRAGVTLLEGRVIGVERDSNGVSGVRVTAHGEESTIATRCFVNAAGPLQKPVAELVETDLPVFSELHVKMSFKDHLGLVPRDAPLLIWDDPQRLEWTPEEAEWLSRSEETHFLSETMPAGAHLRPEGREHVIVLWPYHAEPVAVTYPIEIPPNYGEIALRGVMRMLPALSAYLDRLPTPFIDGGYYTKTAENRPLACPLNVAGSYLIGALSGFGLMVSAAAADLLARHITGDSLPDYAPSFHLARYDDPDYVDRFSSAAESGQL